MVSLRLIDPRFVLAPTYLTSYSRYDWAPAGTFAPSWWNNGPTASNGECGVPFAARFPSPGATAASPFWYSFVFGNVFVAAVSSEHDWQRGSEQWLWLNACVTRDARGM